MQRPPGHADGITAADLAQIEGTTMAAASVPACRLSLAWRPFDEPDEWRRQVRRRAESPARDLPWLDLGKAVFVAANRIDGDDVAIALDYRTSNSDPRVVASDWWTDPGVGNRWREVTPTFSTFVAALALTDVPPPA